MRRRKVEEGESWTTAKTNGHPKSAVGRELQKSNNEIS